jgi:hypothetical protein
MISPWGGIMGKHIYLNNHEIKFLRDIISAAEDSGNWYEYTEPMDSIKEKIKEKINWNDFEQITPPKSAKERWKERINNR